MEKKIKEIKINIIPVPGDPLEKIIEAIAPNIRSVLSKHGATLKMGVEEFLRAHAKGELNNDGPNES